MVGVRGKGTFLSCFLAFDLRRWQWGPDPHSWHRNGSLCSLVERQWSLSQVFLGLPSTSGGLSVADNRIYSAWSWQMGFLIRY
jgi:hypothetical protein